jgi:hypothetical protein
MGGKRAFSDKDESVKERAKRERRAGSERINPKN